MTPPDRELTRILALPRRAPIKVDRDPLTGLYTPEAEALADVETARYALADNEPPAHDLGRALGSCRCKELFDAPCIRRFFPSQAWYLRELRLNQGALGMMTVAAGKTLVSILSALAVPCTHALLMIKPDQRLHYLINYLRLREHFRVPSFIFHEGAIKGPWGDDFRGAIIPGMPVVRVLPYSMLSRPESSALLETELADVDAVFGDEIHCLSDRKSRRTARWLRFMAGKRGLIPFGGSSGSAIKKGIADISHLSLFALGPGSPYPLDQKNEVPRWAAVVDPSNDPDTRSSTYRALRSALAHRDDEPDALESLFGGSLDAIREGILDRVIHTPGVVATRVSEATASVTLAEFKIPALPAKIRQLLADVRQRWVRPDGEELQEAMEAVGCARNISVGFYYYWHFKNNPDPKLVARWFAARKAWCKEVRTEIARDIPHLDSQHLLENAARRAYQQPAYQGHLPVWAAKTWPEWAAVKDLIEYEPRSEWVDDFFAEACADWARKTPRGIVWVESIPLGERIAKLSGCTYHRGGTHAEERILAERGDKAIIASMSSHREGRDGLQHCFFKGVVAEPMSSGDGWHQLIGRYCRPGQPEDTVEMAVPLHVEEFRNAMRSAYRYARFDSEMSPNSQLLLAADQDEGVAACAL